MTTKSNYISDFYEEEILNGGGGVPELYIDKKILPKDNICFENKNHKIYRINGELFYEDDRNQNELQEFSLEFNDQFEDNEDWIFEVKQNSYIVMVNSIILLSCYQWNTITDECPAKCLVCNIILQDPKNHIKTEDHVTNLEKHKPLKKFNLHITRPIGDKYHCAVCNELYEKYNNTHLDSEKHLERMLYATNRATDSVYDFDISNDNRSVNNDNDDIERRNDTVSTSESGFDSDGFYDLNYFNNNKSTLRSYASVVKQSLTETPSFRQSFIEHVIGNKTFTIEFDTYHMILRPNSIEFYCMLCILFDDVNNTSDHCKSDEHLKKLKQCEIMNIHDEHFIRKVTTKFYHCGTCNNLQLTGAIEAHLETHGKKHENNNKAKEQDNKINKNSDKGNVQENRVNEKGDKVNVQENKINVNNDKRNAQENEINISGHKVIVQENKINISGHKVNVQENKINICGHKVNVQKNKINENSDKRNVQEYKTNEVTNKVSESSKQPAPSNQLCGHPTRPAINNRNPNIHNYIIITRFNCNIRVSFMAYNLILSRGVDFICLLCNYVSPDMTMHLRDVRHIVCLENFPFLPFFGVHLVRAIHQYAHCAICNVLVNTSLIHLHTLSEPHVVYLNKALHPINNIIAMNQTNIGSNQSVNTKQSTHVNQCCPPEDLQAISTNNSDLNQASVTETAINQTIDLNQSSPPENLQAIPTNNSETLNEASITETAINQTIDVNQTEIESDNLEYDIEDDLNILKEFIYLKIKKSLAKVSIVSYHSLVHTGDGNRYCFICSYKVTKSLRGHILSKAHINRMKKCKFISNYDKDLLRQVKLTYHCCICNVLVKKSEIKNHLIWPVHKENATFLKLRKRVHLNNIIDVEFQTKDTTLNEKEPQIQLVFKMTSGKKTMDNIGGLVINIPPNKEYRGKIFNIPWDAWQGITRYEHGGQCNMCHDFFVDIDTHLEEDSHKKLVSTPIEKQYLPACIRKISEDSLNCVTCNLVFSNKEKNISQHMGGKTHLGNYEKILQTAFTDVSRT